MRPANDARYFLALARGTEMDVRQQIRDFISANFYVADAAALGDDVSLLESGIIDSTGVLEIIIFIEENFGINVEDYEMLPDNLDSIERIAAFVTRKAGNVAA